MNNIRAAVIYSLEKAEGEVVTEERIREKLDYIRRGVAFSYSVEEIEKNLLERTELEPWQISESLANEVRKALRSAFNNSIGYELLGRSFRYEGLWVSKNKLLFIAKLLGLTVEKTYRKDNSNAPFLWEIWAEDVRMYCELSHEDAGCKKISTRKEIKEVEKCVASAKFEKVVEEVEVPVWECPAGKIIST
ncbi:MAG: hypothetical protein KKC55_17435 [Gammaproteobacteria bacterium]|nr:hypothetical protein [Gammaproteobacteria bacterium]